MIFDLLLHRRVRDHGVHRVQRKGSDFFGLTVLICAGTYLIVWRIARIAQTIIRPYKLCTMLKFDIRRSVELDGEMQV